MDINIRCETGLYFEPELFRLSAAKVLRNYRERLNLNGLESITLVSNTKLRKYSLASLSADFKEIKVSDILFLETREHLHKQKYNIAKLEEAIFHELIHVDHRNKFPNLNKISEKYADENEEDVFESWTTVFWVEYSVNNLSLQISSARAIDEMATNIVNNKWTITSQSDMLMFLKYVAELISIIKVQGGDSHQKWIEKIEDIKIKQTILKIIEQIHIIENRWGASFDEYENLKPLELCIIKSYNYLIFYYFGQNIFSNAGAY